jgi:hypothetical protein
VPVDVKKSSKDNKKPSKPDDGKSKSQKPPPDSAQKNGQSPRLKSLPDQSTPPASAGVEGILSGEDKGTAKPNSDPKAQPPTKGLSDTASDT